MFLDQIQIEVTAGHGGPGATSFRREKFAPQGGPDGGDGGEGGSVFIRGNRNLNTLNHYRNARKFSAESGHKGEGSMRSGKAGEDIYLDMPLGVVLVDKMTGNKVGEILSHGETLCVAVGGRGGQGNARFRSSTNRAPRHHQPGESGQEFTLDIELKMIADVGLVGFPNAGKSTLVSLVSAAKPKIADYPFTTLEPQLGVVDIKRFGSEATDGFVIADIPGLIEGAAQGAGLGIKFLRHIERTRMLIHIVDLSDTTRRSDLAIEIIEKELEAFSRPLSQKKVWLVGNKMDAAQDDSNIKYFQQACEKRKQPPRLVSCATGEGIRELMLAIFKDIHETDVP
ncbi:MAG: GTPase ObgE [Holophagaceae bacterium]